MPANNGHSLISPSGAHQWMHCTPSVRFVQSLDLPPEEEKDYAAEGTLAHYLCEMWLKKAVKPSFDGWMRVPGDDAVPVPCGAGDEGAMPLGPMEPHVTAYVEYVRSLTADEEPADVELHVEQRIDLSRWIPHTFGSADSLAYVMRPGTRIPERMYLNDFKYGQGVRVPIDYGPPGRPDPNPQLTLYAFGALRPSVRTVTMSIIQPRRDHIVSMTLSRDELTAAAARIIAKGNEAWQGVGRFVPGTDICRFCRAVPYCRAYAAASGLPLPPARGMQAQGPDKETTSKGEHHEQQ